MRQALSALFRSFGVTTLAIATIGVALAVLATFVVIVGNLKRLADELGREVEISVYLEKGIKIAEGQVLVRQVNDIEGVKEARFLSSKLAMVEFKKSMGEDAVLLEGLPADVLPPSIEVRLDPKAWAASSVAVIASSISKLSKVEDVRFGQEDIERVNTLLDFTKIAAAVLGIALALATVLIVSNTIRLTVYARRDEIEIMSLVGATDAFVKAPFVLEGAIQGVLGGLVAAAGLMVFEEGVRTGLERGLSYAYGPSSLDFVPLQYLGYLLALGAVLGLLGSRLAVGKFLRL